MQKYTQKCDKQMNSENRILRKVSDLNKEDRDLFFPCHCHNVMFSGNDLIVYDARMNSIHCPIKIRFKNRRCERYLVGDTEEKLMKYYNIVKL